MASRELRDRTAAKQKQVDDALARAQKRAEQTGPISLSMAADELDQPMEESESVPDLSNMTEREQEAREEARHRRAKHKELMAVLPNAISILCGPDVSARFPFVHAPS